MSNRFFPDLIFPDSLKIPLSWGKRDEITLHNFDGSFTLPETDSGTDSGLDSKLNGYIALCRTCSLCTDSDLDPYFCIGQESEFVSISESVCGNINEPHRLVFLPTVSYKVVSSAL